MRTLPPRGQLPGIRVPEGVPEILTGNQVQKKGCPTSELLEVEGAGLWLLLGQAVGLQSGGADIRKEK